MIIQDEIERRIATPQRRVGMAARIALYAAVALMLFYGGRATRSGRVRCLENRANRAVAAYEAKSSEIGHLNIRLGEQEGKTLTGGIIERAQLAAEQDVAKTERAGGYDYPILIPTC